MTDTDAALASQLAAWICKFDVGHDGLHSWSTWHENAEPAKVLPFPSVNLSQGVNEK